MNQQTKDRINTTFSEHIETIKTEGATTGSEIFVRFPVSLQKKYHISPVGTVTKELDEIGRIKMTYRAGPKYYESKGPQLHRGIPTLQEWYDKWRDGVDPGNIADLIPEEINAHMSSKTSSFLTTVRSYAESFMFTKMKKVVMVDPSYGALWRAHTHGCHVSIISTSTEKKWAEEIHRYFMPHFKASRLMLDVIDEPEDDDMVYHGANGFKPVKGGKAFCFEPNPYSKDLRNGHAIAIKRELSRFVMTYMLKDRLLTYYWEDLPNYYRVDPITLSIASQLRGDFYFLATRFQPAQIGFAWYKKRLTSLACCYYYDEFPQTKIVQLGDYNVVADKGMLYDVDVGATILSRRHLLYTLAEKYGWKVAPLAAGYGKWVAHPYGNEFIKTSYVKKGEKIVCEDYTMYNEEPPQGERRYHEHSAVIFLPNDFTGRKVTPLEAFGTVHSIDTFTVGKDPRRYPYHQKYDKGYIFSSESMLKQCISFICHMEQRDVVQMIDYDKEREDPSPTILGNILEDDTPHHTGERRPPSDRTTLAEFFSLLPKTRYQIEQEYKDRPWHVLLGDMWQTPGLAVNVQADPLEWYISSGYEPYDDYDEESEGLMFCDNQLEIKRDMIGGKLTWRDKREADTSARVKDLAAWGWRVARTETTEETVSLTFVNDQIEM